MVLAELLFPECDGPQTGRARFFESAQLVEDLASIAVADGPLRVVGAQRFAANLDGAVAVKQSLDGPLQRDQRVTDVAVNAYQIGIIGPQRELGDGQRLLMARQCGRWLSAYFQGRAEVGVHPDLLPF